MLVRINFILVALFAALNVAARAAGSLQPAHPALLGFTESCGDKPQPCWYGVVPGVTTDQEIYDLLDFAGEPEFSKSIFSRDFTLIFNLPEASPYCRAVFEFIHGVVFQGEIILCRQPVVRVGDVMLFLASEKKALSLPPHELVYGAVSMNVTGWPMPHSRVSLISLLSPEMPIQHYPWRGFVPFAHYCQLTPGYPRCAGRRGGRF